MFRAGELPTGEDQPGLFPQFLPFLDIPAVVIERQPVPVAIKPVTIFAVEREIDPLAADCTGFVQGVFLLPEQLGKKAGDPVSRFHGEPVRCTM
jgi:hypothetical protein